VLEAYLLGELTNTEVQELEHNLAQFPELRTELFKLEKLYESLLFMGSVRPPHSVKTELLQEIRKLKRQAD
jgi:hypothetical protein